MSLQSWIDWWRKFSSNKREEISCGVWPTAFPAKFDIFLKCCKMHDASYRTSEVLFAQGVVESDEALKTQAIDIKARADENFFTCVRARYQKSSRLFYPLTKRWGEEYISLVTANSDRIWFGSIGVIIADAEAGDHPVIKMAIRRAMENGSLEETEIVKQAYSLPRKTKISH